MFKRTTCMCSTRSEMSIGHFWSCGAHTSSSLKHNLLVDTSVQAPIEGEHTSKLCLRELLVCAPQDQKCPYSPSIGACTVSTSKLCLRELLVCAPQDQKCPCSPSIGACTVSTSKEL
jgi:hypothetical protein